MIFREQLEEPSLDPGRAVQDGNQSSSKSCNFASMCKDFGAV